MSSPDGRKEPVCADCLAGGQPVGAPPGPAWSCPAVPEPPMSILALRRLRAWFLLLGIAALGACGGGDPAPAGPSETPLQLAPPRVGGTYVRPPGAARLLGMNIGAKNYDDPTYQAQLARLDVVILGFY